MIATIKHGIISINLLSLQKVGDLNFEICKKNLDEMVTVEEGVKTCTIKTLLWLNLLVL